MALGAGRGRIVGQMLAENAVLALLGGGLGVLFAVWVVRVLPRLAGANFTQLNDVHLDWRVLLFAAVISMVATLLFGLAPALAAARRGLADSIKQRSAAGAGGFGFFGRNGARTALTVTQIALALASVGIYGVLTSQVAQSTREVGIQMALGAAPARIRGAVIGHGAVLALIGVGIGLAASWGLSRFFASLLFGITPMDPASYGGAAVALVLVALVGVYVPARRATKVDPVVALRCE